MTEPKKAPVEGLEFDGDVQDIPITLSSIRVAAGKDGKVWCFLDVGNDTWHGIGVPVEVAMPFAEAIVSVVAMMAAPGLSEAQADAFANTSAHPIKKEYLN